MPGVLLNIIAQMFYSTIDFRKTRKILRFLILIPGGRCLSRSANETCADFVTGVVEREVPQHTQVLYFKSQVNGGEQQSLSLVLTYSKLKANGIVLGG
jgi:hypothetical protein